MRSMAGLALLLTLALLMAGCARFSLFRRADALSQKDAPRVGMAVPEIDGVDFDGKPFKLSDYRGKVVVVTFWASWCRPCRAMIPHERELVERHRGKPFALLSVNNDENHDDARKIMTALGMNWPNWKTAGCNDPITRRWGVKAWPAVFVIDANGILRYTHVRGAYLENAVETLLAEVDKSERQAASSLR